MGAQGRDTRDVGGRAHKHSLTSGWSPSFTTPKFVHGISPATGLALGEVVLLAAISLDQGLS